MRFPSFRIFTSFVAMAVFILPLHAQTAPPPTQKFGFEVVAIHPANPNEQVYGYGIQPTMIRLRLYAVVLDALLKQGYPPQDLIAGLPNWVRGEPYDIEAKFNDNTAQAFAKMTTDERREALMPMLQQLLAVRCKLIYHRIPTELPAFALVVHKGGPHLKPAIEGEPTPEGAHPWPDGAKVTGFQRGGPAIMHFFNAPMADLIATITMPGLILVDQTGLTGRYDFDVPRADQEHPGLDMNADLYTKAHFYDISGLGLDLKPIKLPADKIVIDSMEKPTEN